MPARLFLCETAHPIFARTCRKPGEGANVLACVLTPKPIAVAYIRSRAGAVSTMWHIRYIMYFRLRQQLSGFASSGSVYTSRLMYVPPHWVRVWCPWCRRAYWIGPLETREIRAYRRVLQGGEGLPHAFCEEHAEQARAALQARQNAQAHVQAVQDYFDRARDAPEPRPRPPRRRKWYG